MLGGNLYQSARKFFDYGYATAERGSVSVEDTFDIQTICDIARLPQLTDIYAYLVNNLKGDWLIQFKDMDSYAYDMDVENKILSVNAHGLTPTKALNSTYFTPQILIALAEGLRMVRHVEWLDGVMENYNPESVMFIGRLCVADSMAQTIMTAWLAKCDDYDAMWKHLLCSDYAAMTMQFARTYEALLASGNDDETAMKRSMAMALNTWFANTDKVFQCDQDSLGMMDDMLEQGIRFGVKSIDARVMTCLTVTAGETTSYIDQSHITDIITNPYYMAVSDGINRAHLMQIIDDAKCTFVNGIPFQDTALAARFALCE